MSHRSTPSRYSEAIPHEQANLVSLPEALRGVLERHVVTGFPSECCGVLLGMVDGRRVQVEEVVPAMNIASGDRRRRYQIDWRTLLSVMKRTREGDASLVGFYHSHPDGSARPSRTDLAFAWDDVFYLIVPVACGAAGRPTAWYKRSGEKHFEQAPVEMSGVAVR